MSSISFSFEEQINTKYEAYRLIHDPTRLLALLYSKYGDIEEDLYFLYANQLIYNLPTKFNCIYKELKYTNLTHDYLKRIYKLMESINRIPKLSDYYKNYHLFFCRPTLRSYKLSKIMCNYQDKKAEIFYKNNYKETKEMISVEKEENNPVKGNSSFSFSSVDNITNNKIIFDKQTKKMLDKSETDLKNNNYYNTLILETSRSNTLLNNGLISKRTGGSSSFEKCITALVESQFKKNKNKDSKRKYRKSYKNKKLKNIIINDNNLNKYSKIKNNISQSQRENRKFYNFKIYNNNSSILNNKENKIHSNNTSNSNNNYINKIIKNNNKKKSLYSISNNRYNTSTTTLLYNNKYKINDIKEFNINYPITTTNKDTNKNKSHAYSNNNTINKLGNSIKNNSNTMPNILSNSNTNINSNPHIIKNMKLCQGNNNNYTKFSKLSQYLKQIKGKDNIIIQKNTLHKKNCFSIGEDGKNILFNLNNKNRITKKKITINKSLKITLTNGNINSNKQNPKHIKNKTLDYNSVSQTRNNLGKKENNNIIINEEYNSLLNKNINKIDNKNNKNIFTKIYKSSNNKKAIFSPSSTKITHKISVTQHSSKEKSYKKDLNIKIFSPNNKKKTEYEYNQKINSPKHIKNNKSTFTISNINNHFLIKSSKNTKTNFNASMNGVLNNNINIKSIISKNTGTLFSPKNQHFNSIVYFKRNINQNSNANNINNNNNIYIKKSIKKENKIINKTKNLKGSNNNNNHTTKELYNNKYLTNDNNKKNHNNSNNENNTKNSKKRKIHTKSNSKKKSLNNKFMTNENININNKDFKNNKNKRNINISIEKNNINIKDSILHIDKVYIKDENSDKKQKIYEIEMSSSQTQKPIEIKVEENIINALENDKNIKKEKIKSMDYTNNKINNSPKVINVHRNFNLFTKNNK